MSVLVLSASMLAIVLMAVLAVMLAGAVSIAPMALGAAIALYGGIVLLAQPFLGAAALTAFSHLDAVEKLLFGFLPVSAFKLITAATVAALLLTAHRMRDHVRDVLRSPVVVMAIVFLMVAAVSLAGAENRELGLAAMRKMLSLVLLLVLIALLADTRRKVQVLLWILVATSLISSLILIVDVTFGVQLVAQSDAATTARTFEGVTRSAGGSDYNPTTAAALLLVGVVFALVHALENPVWRWRLLVIAGIGTIAVVLSFARSAALAYVVIGLALVWRYRRWRYLPLALAVAVIAGLGLLPFVPAEYWERLSSIVGGAADPTLERRLTYNLIGIDLFVQNPLFGVGPGNFVHHFTDSDYRFLPGRTLIGRELHNMYLSVVVQYGLLGALPFFAMLVIAFRQLRAVCADPSDAGMRGLALALGYGFAAYMLASLFLPNEETKYTWLFPGLATALYVVNQRERAGR